MWPGTSLGSEAKWHEMIHVYASKTDLASQTGWLYANSLL